MRIEWKTWYKHFKHKDLSKNHIFCSKALKKKIVDILSIPEYSGVSGGLDLGDTLGDPSIPAS